MPKPSTPELGLLLIEKHEGGYFHITGHVVELHGPRSEGIKNPHDTWADDLEVYSQGNDQTYDGKTCERHLYGWEVHYRGSSIGLAEARRMVKALEKVEKGQVKLDALRGYALDFGEFVGRVCEILGLTTILAKTADDRSWSYADSSFRRMPLGEGVSYIRSRTNAWIEAGKTPTEPSTV